MVLGPGARKNLSVIESHTTDTFQRHVRDIKKKLIIFLKKKQFDSKILQDKLLCIFHNFTM